MSEILTETLFHFKQAVWSGSHKEGFQAATLSTMSECVGGVTVFNKNNLHKEMQRQNQTNKGTLIMNWKLFLF